MEYRKPKMKKEYIAVLLGVLLTAMTTSGANYIGTREGLVANNVRISKIEEESKRNANFHKEVNLTLKELAATNAKMQNTLTRIATIIEIKLGEGDASEQ